MAALQLLGIARLFRVVAPCPKPPQAHPQPCPTALSRLKRRRWRNPGTRCDWPLVGVDQIYRAWTGSKRLVRDRPIDDPITHARNKHASATAPPCGQHGRTPSGPNPAGRPEDRDRVTDDRCDVVEGATEGIPVERFGSAPCPLPLPQPLTGRPPRPRSAEHRSRRSGPGPRRGASERPAHRCRAAR